MFHCGDIVKVTDVDFYDASIFNNGNKFTVVGIHPVNSYGEFSKNTKDIQFICTNGVTLSYPYILGCHLKKVGEKAYNKQIFDKAYPLNVLRRILRSPHNEVETYIYSKCSQELETAVAKFCDNAKVNVKLTSVGWGKDYATIRGNTIQMLSSIKVHLWLDK